MILWLIAAAQLGQPPAPALPADIERRARSATVRISNRTKMAEANGVVIDRTAQQDAFYILTSAHVGNPTDRLEITFYPQGAGAQKHTVKNVRWVATANQFAQDLAILRVVSGEKVLVDVLPLAPAGGAQAAKGPFTAFSLACTPFGDAEPQAEKVLGAPFVPKKAGQKGFQFWKCEAAPEPGRSGGPLIDAKGNLLGICSGGDDKASYYSHCDEIRAFLISEGLKHLTKPKPDNPQP